MHLSRLYIENYRSIQKIDLKFERGKNVIVGRNNSGKSNILKAIDLVLGEYSPTYVKSLNITDVDFYCGKFDKPIFIWCEINRDLKEERADLKEERTFEELDFSEVNKTAFYRLYEDISLTQEIRITLSDFNDSEKRNIFEFCSDEGQQKIDDNSLKKKWIGGRSYCKKNYLHEFSNKTKFAIAFTAFKNSEGIIQKELVLLYRESNQEDWIQGINCNIRNVLIQSAVIPAFRDPKDQLRINQYTWFGKLLKAYIKTDGEELTKAFKAVKEASDELFQVLKDNIVEKEIEIAFPNTSISFQFNPDTKQDIHKSTLIYVNDGFNSELKDKGAGIQSAVIIGLFDFYVRNIVHDGSSLLAVEEPELYLHPHGKRVISNRLSKFVDNGKNQVILTTHTTEFISNTNENQNVIVVKKDKVETKAKNIKFDSPKRKQILIKKQNAEMFFADAVILSEGADKYFIEEAARCFGTEIDLVSEQGEVFKLGINWINDHNISIINCGGKDELVKYAEILKELEIPFLTTADFDFLKSGINDYLTKLKFEKKLTDELNALKSKIAQRLGKMDYKEITQLKDTELMNETNLYLLKLRKQGVFIFSGELENFYKIKPKYDKEAGVIETLGKLIEKSKPISEFVNTEEYYALFFHFVLTILNYKNYADCS